MSSVWRSSASGGRGPHREADLVEPDASIFIAIPVGMFVTIVASIAWTGIVMKRRDLGLMYGNAAALLGGGVGVLAAATVSDKGYTVFHESDRILTTVTFTFTDLQGVQRWVQRTMTVSAADPIENGQETRLWYDAANPGNDRAIVVELAYRSPLRAR